jgi:PleD family two-component response regulator
MPRRGSSCWSYCCPDGNGFDLRKEIRTSADTSSGVVLMLSTETEVTHRVGGLNTGADEYVGKLYDIHYRGAKRLCQYLQAWSRPPNQ